MFDIDDSVPPGWLAMRYTVRVESGAPEADVMRVIDHADKHSSILYGFRTALWVERSVEITAPSG
jgi:hypothetical protein